MSANPKIKTKTFGVPRNFKDVPVGGFFRAFAAGKYVRFIKGTDDGKDIVVAIGPFYDEAGPAYFNPEAFSFHADTLCIDETGLISLRPSDEEPCPENVPHRHGNLIVTAAENYIFLDLSPGTPRDKFLFSLNSGQIVPRPSSHRRIVFDKYTLVRAKSGEEIAFEWPRTVVEKPRAA